MARTRHGFLLASLTVGVALAAAARGIVGAATKAFPQSLEPLRAVPSAVPAGASDGLAAYLVLAHDALPTAAKPQGWAYPFACCADFDCEAVPESAIVEGARGYEIRSTGELIPMSDRRVKDSPDGQFHWCAHRAGLDAGKTICLFVPPRSF